MRVRTYARVKGIESQGWFEQAADENEEETTNCVWLDERSGLLSIESNSQTHRFAFDGVFGPRSEQDEVFEKAVAPLVHGGLQGINATIFAYGQTGSGKTYSITGGASYESRGMVPRALSRLFDDRNLVRCAISYVEVYNEEVLDLLNGRNKIPMFAKAHDEKGNVAVHLKNLTVKDIRTEEEALDLFFRGNMERSTGCTLLNMSSSRSHALFSITVETRDRIGRLNFVDLAGSERVQDNTSKHINLSLHFLEQVVLNLQNQQDHISFRNSTMTWLLKDSLVGNCQTVFLITLNQHSRHRSETLSSCRFAQRCRSLSTQVSQNETLEQKVARLEKENAMLKNDLAVALESLEEHDRIRNMLQDLLNNLDQDALSQISSEVSFLNKVDIQVDVKDELVLVSHPRQFGALQIPRESISSVERSTTESGHSIFRVLGRPKTKRWNFTPTSRQASPSSPPLFGQKVLFELIYANDGTMMEQVSWVQAFEHWLGPDIQYDHLQEPASVFLEDAHESKEDVQERENLHVPKPPSFSSRKSIGAAGVLRKAISAFSHRGRSLSVPQHPTSETSSNLL